MTKPKYFKSEPTNIRGICVLCQKNLQKGRPNNKYMALCSSCDSKRTPKTYATKLRAIKKQKFKYRRFKKEICETCGFIPKHSCQLDVDHHDGNRKNSDPGNLKTLCANCHRLKTYLNKEFLPR